MPAIGGQADADEGLGQIEAAWGDPVLRDIVKRVCIGQLPRRVNRLTDIMDEYGVQVSHEEAQDAITRIGLKARRETAEDYGRRAMAVLGALVK